MQVSRCSRCRAADHHRDGENSRDAGSGAPAAPDGALARAPQAQPGPLTTSLSRRRCTGYQVFCPRRPQTCTGSSSPVQADPGPLPPGPGAAAPEDGPGGERLADPAEAIPGGQAEDRERIALGLNCDVVGGRATAHRRYRESVVRTCHGSDSGLMHNLSAPRERQGPATPWMRWNSGHLGISGITVFDRPSGLSRAPLEIRLIHEHNLNAGCFLPAGRRPPRRPPALFSLGLDVRHVMVVHHDPCASRASTIPVQAVPASSTTACEPAGAG